MDDEGGARVARDLGVDVEVPHVGGVAAPQRLPHPREGLADLVEGAEPAVQVVDDAQGRVPGDDGGEQPGAPRRGEQDDGAALGLAEQDKALGVDGGPRPLPRGRPRPGRVDDGVEIGDLGQEGRVGHVPARPAAAEGEAEGRQARPAQVVGDVDGGCQGGGDAVAADDQGRPPAGTAG